MICFIAKKSQTEQKFVHQGDCIVRLDMIFLTYDVFTLNGTLLHSGSLKEALLKEDTFKVMAVSPSTQILVCYSQIKNRVMILSMILNDKLEMDVKPMIWYST